MCKLLAFRDVSTYASIRQILIPKFNDIAGRVALTALLRRQDSITAARNT